MYIYVYDYKNKLKALIYTILVDNILYTARQCIHDVK